MAKNCHPQRNCHLNSATMMTRLASKIDTSNNQIMSPECHTQRRLSPKKEVTTHVTANATKRVWTAKCLGSNLTDNLSKLQPVENGTTKLFNFPARPAHPTNFARKNPPKSPHSTTSRVSTGPTASDTTAECSFLRKNPATA